MENSNLSEELQKAFDKVLKAEQGTSILFFEEQCIIFQGVYKGHDIKISVERTPPTIYEYINGHLNAGLQTTCFVNDEPAFTSDESLTPVECRKYISIFEQKIKREQRFNRQDAYNFILEN